MVGRKCVGSSNQAVRNSIDSFSPTCLRLGPTRRKAPGVSVSCNTAATLRVAAENVKPSGSDLRRLASKSKTSSSRRREVLSCGDSTTARAFSSARCHSATRWLMACTSARLAATAASADSTFGCGAFSFLFNSVRAASSSASALANAFCFSTSGGNRSGSWKSICLAVEV